MSRLLIVLTLVLSACALPILPDQTTDPAPDTTVPVPVTTVPVDTTVPAPDPTAAPEPETTVPATTLAPVVTVPASSTTVPVATTAPSTTVPAPPVTTVPAPTTTQHVPSSSGILIDRVGSRGDPSGDDTGNFRTTCRPSHVLADDPIVRPGAPGASHLHQFWGNRSVTAFSTTMMTGESTCAGGAANRSGYWTPSVIDAQGRPITAHFAGIYYKSGYQGIPHEQIRYLPAGLRIVSDQAWWTCTSATDYARHATIPACPAGERVIAHVNFPQCWDTVNLDSPDHRSHMRYGQQGGCPASHPYPITEITINAEFIVPAGGSSGLSLSSDMGAAPGSTLHGDWWNGWDETVMRTWVDNCIRPGIDCHVDLLGDGTQLRWQT